MSISSEQRDKVAKRASYHCEYCRLHQDYSVKTHQCDHIIPRKHGGNDTAENLAWACYLCNGSKGSEVAAYAPETGQLTPIFNPRIHRWNDHFHLGNGEISTDTAIGRVTILVLQLNRRDKVEHRQILLQAGLHI